MAGARTAADQRQGSLRHQASALKRTHPDVTEIFLWLAASAGERKSALTPQALWQDLLGQHSPIDAAAAVEGDLRCHRAPRQRASSWQWTVCDSEACATASTVAYSALQSGLMPWRARLGSSADQAVFEPLPPFSVAPATRCSPASSACRLVTAPSSATASRITRYWTPRFTPARPMADAKAAAGVAPRPWPSRWMAPSPPASSVGGVDSSPPWQE